MDLNPSVVSCRTLAVEKTSFEKVLFTLMACPFHPPLMALTFKKMNKYYKY